MLSRGLLRRVIGSTLGGGTIALAMALASPVSADRSDGIYGRLDADSFLSASLVGGASWNSSNAIAVGVGSAEVRIRYLDSVGALIAPIASSDGRDPALDLGLGFEVRPAFLPRFFLNRQSGRAYWDLFVDSIGIEMGAVFGPFGHRTTRSGAAFFVGAGFDLPIYVARDSRVFIRVAFRYIDAPPRSAYAPSSDASSGRGEFSLLSGVGYAFGL